MAHTLLNNLCLLLGHTDQHLKFDTVGNAAVLSQQQCKRHIEEVMSSNTQADVLGMFGAQGVIKDTLVVSIRCLLGVPGGDGPTVHHTFNNLHGEVGALNEANLNTCATVLNAACSPLLQADHSGKSVRQVRLQHDTRFEVLQLRLIQDLGEHVKGHVQILVLLHVQVNELGGAGGGSQFVQRGQAAD